MSHPAFLTPGCRERRREEFCRHILHFKTKRFETKILIQLHSFYTGNIPLAYEDLFFGFTELEHYWNLMHFRRSAGGFLLGYLFLYVLRSQLAGIIFFHIFVDL